uniref:Uncharacterized protein B19A17.140 n=1 Tax=Neurospora crassa TaxID=5141 RepID=Q872N8_NEUCS|nr:hypothetical protein [Neurospora crassa]
MSTILIPLYIYPSFSSSHESSGWAPLFRALTTALTKNPSLEFLVVINPGNGPGPDYPIPNADYRAALSKLSDTTQYPNVKVIGYVHCSYGQREVEEVERDVKAYLGWLEFAERGEWHRHQEDHRPCIASHRIALPITSNHPPVNTGLWQHCTITSESPIQQPGKDISYDARRAADHGYQWLLKNRRRLDTWTPPYPHLQVVRTVSPAGRSPGHALEPGTVIISGTGDDLGMAVQAGFLRQTLDDSSSVRVSPTVVSTSLLFIPSSLFRCFLGEKLLCFLGKSLASTQFPNGASSTGMSKDPELSTEAQLELLLELAERPHFIFASGRRKFETSAGIACSEAKEPLNLVLHFLETGAHWCFSRGSGLVWRSPHAHGPQGWRSMSERKSNRDFGFPKLAFSSVFFGESAPLQPGSAPTRLGSNTARSQPGLGPTGILAGRISIYPCFFPMGSLSLFAGKQTGIRSLKGPVLAIDTRRRAVHGPLLCFVPLPALCISHTKAIRLDGIFVDEVPIDAQYLDYLQRITDSVRSGFAEAAYRRSHCDSINSSENTSLSAPSSSATSSTTGLGIVIHNPGIFPSADSSDAFFSPRLVNYVVVFENCLAAWWDSGDYVNANLALLTPEKRAKAIAVAHTCGCGPKSQAGGSSGGRPQQPDLEGHHAAEAEKTEGSEKEAIKKNVQNFLDEVVTQHKLAGHFATSATDYATWCSGWEGYVEVACDLGGSNMLTGEASEEGLHG